MLKNNLNISSIVVQLWQTIAQSQGELIVFGVALKDGLHLRLLTTLALGCQRPPHGISYNLQLLIVQIPIGQGRWLGNATDVPIDDSLW